MNFTVSVLVISITISQCLSFPDQSMKLTIVAIYFRCKWLKRIVKRYIEILVLDFLTWRIFRFYWVHWVQWNLIDISAVSSICGQHDPIIYISTHTHIVIIELLAHQKAFPIEIHRVNFIQQARRFFLNSNIVKSSLLWLVSRSFHQYK